MKVDKEKVLQAEVRPPGAFAGWLSLVFFVLAVACVGGLLGGDGLFSLIGALYLCLGFLAYLVFWVVFCIVDMFRQAALIEQEHGE